MATKLTEKLQQERCGALVEVLQQFAAYVDGTTTLPDGSTLRDALGDYHLSQLVQDIEAHYKVRLSDIAKGKAVIDHDHLMTLLVANKPGFHTYELRQYIFVEFADTLGASLKEIVESNDVREIDRRHVMFALEAIITNCVSSLLQLPKSR